MTVACAPEMIETTSQPGCALCRLLRRPQTAVRPPVTVWGLLLSCNVLETGAAMAVPVASGAGTTVAATAPMLVGVAASVATGAGTALVGVAASGVAPAAAGSGVAEALAG